MSKSTRLCRDGYPEFEYAFIRAIDGEVREDRFWSPMRYPSHIKRIYVRTDDQENLEIKRAQVRKWIADQATDVFLDALTPAEPATEPEPVLATNVIPMQGKKLSTILRRYAPRA